MQKWPSSISINPKQIDKLQLPALRLFTMYLGCHAMPYLICFLNANYAAKRVSCKDKIIKNPKLVVVKKECLYNNNGGASPIGEYCR